MAEVAVVTGASRGIGLEVTRQLSEQGITVVGCARNAKSVDEATRGFPTEVIPVSCDVRDDEQVAALGGMLDQFEDGVSILVNNAGVVIDGWSGSVLETPLDTLRETWEINSLGALRVTRAALPHLQRAAGTPRIVNVSSGMGQLSEMGGRSPGYRTSKTLLNAFTRILAGELEDEVFVASVCPGWVRTDMGGDSAPRSVEVGADTIVWLATEHDPTTQSGRFWRDREIIDW
jgi:NAD(P)-dependent dehydrogenase (short-subunit alcohol dehydrogenase family)